jgi:hypothetical protein
MLLLSIHHIKDSFYALPLEKQGELTMGVFAFSDKYLKNEKMKLAYTFCDSKGSAAVWDVESAEELMKLYMEYPLTPYIETENIPIVAFESAGKFLRKERKPVRRQPKSKSYLMTAAGQKKAD